jgi:predicted nuclease of restriction endonuclease-like (RecB) superfamily
MTNKMEKPAHFLFNDIRELIDNSRQRFAVAVNAELTLLYWNIGKKINDHILGNERAEYGKQILATLAQELTEIYGKGWNEKTLRHSLRSAETFSEEQILYAVRRELSWTHIRNIMYLKDELQREFYLEICASERWSSRQLQERINSMLFERTAISKKPDELIRIELQQLREENKPSPDLIFRDTYILDFLGLKDMYSEKNLEDAIIRELERFILEFGKGFAFVERQKRMVIDGEDFSLDLLFYHRVLRRLVAVELKLGKFKAEYKSKMELYLVWLEKHEMQPGEETPIGLLLCSEGNREQVELLQLHRSGIKLAEYLTELPSKELLQKKLHQAIQIARKKLENYKAEEQ